MSFSIQAAYFVATYGNRVPGGRRVRAATKQTEFMNRVNARVAEWTKADVTKRRESRRMKIVRNAIRYDNTLQDAGKAPRLSTFKDTVNKGPKTVEFKITKSIHEEAATTGAV